MVNKYEKIFTPLYEDDSIIAVSKEHGVYVIPDRIKKEQLVLSYILSEIYGNIFPVHRLDAGTGGIVLFARNANSHKKLCGQFAKKTIKKEYIAITEGIPFPQTVMLPIGKGNHGKFKINFKSGKKSVTSFTVIESGNQCALVRALPLTGRTHQIRIHLKAMKTPLYQDWLYNKTCSDRRLTLFSSSIRFLHPATGESMTISAPLSDFMKEKSDFLGLSLKNMILNFYDA